MNLSLCITAYNRFNFLRESFEQVIDHPRITEIILMDDCSDMGIFRQIDGLRELSPKIKVYRQGRNRGMSRNKADAISYAVNEWVILFDSDNIINRRYVDLVPLMDTCRVMFQPSFAKPNFDFRKYSGGTFYKSNIGHYIKEPMFNTMCNACNVTVNRNEYLRVYEENPEHKASDTIWMFYLWLKAGNDVFVVPGMEYEHRVHPASGFLQDAVYNMNKAEEVRKLIMQL